MQAYLIIQLKKNQTLIYNILFGSCTQHFFLTIFAILKAVNMPYRRLPNTDKARLRALNKAQSKGEMLDMYDLAFSQKLLYEVHGFLPKFERALYEYQMGLNRQVSSNRGHQEKLKKARLYVSHYIQAMNMAVMRGEVKPKDQTYLGLESETKAVPSLNTEASILEWGEKIIEGDMKRISNGGMAIYSPSMANVKVHYERFKESYSSQKFLQNNTSRLLDNIAELREVGDTIILNIWNEVEKHFSNIINHEKRFEACREYGLIYYYRKGEKPEE